VALQFGFTTSCPSLTMFKGILPGKRQNSTEFTILTNTLNDIGKENTPGDVMQQPLSPRPKSRATSKVRPTKQNQSPVEPQAELMVMNQAFEKLLVSAAMFMALIHGTNHVGHIDRTTFRSPATSARSSRAWIPQ
jgi:hypothetical protein